MTTYHHAQTGVSPPLSRCPPVTGAQSRVCVHANAGGSARLGHRLEHLIGGARPDPRLQLREVGTETGGNSIGHASQTAGDALPQSVSPVALATTIGPDTALELVCDTGGATTFTPGAANDGLARHPRCGYVSWTATP